MPEGHTLHRLAAHFQSLFAGRNWRVSSPQGRFDAGAARLDGRVPECAEAWGKHLFVHVGPDIWQVHLGLYGAFSFRGNREFDGVSTLGAPRAAAENWQVRYEQDGWIIPTAPRGAVRARVHVPDGWADLRGPSTCAVLSAPGYEQVVRRLGPDPLRQPPGEVDVVMVEEFARRLRPRRISVSAALMDQSVIAGVGNIYRAEALFLEQISPERPAEALTDEQIELLWQRLTGQLRDGVAEGVIRTLRPGEQRSDQPGGRRGDTRRHWVYQHQGTPCLRCGETVRMRELAGRRLYWCPGCQTG